MEYKTGVKTKPAPRSEPSGFEKDRRTFQRLLPKLLRQYRGRYVAVYNGRIVDQDKSDESLVARMFQKFGDADFYIGHVEKTPIVYELPSPELA